MEENSLFNIVTLILPELSVAILVAIIVILIVTFFLVKRTSKRNVLLTGLRDTGKTLLYSQLIHSKQVNTHTSMKENSGEYIVNGKILSIVDIPGHERVRDKFFDQYKNGARAVIYMVDSTTIQKEVRDVAEYLYNLLSDPIVSQNRVPFLIACNKQDVPLSKNNKAVKSLLERELTTLLVTKSSQLESVDPKSKKASLLISDGEKFDFARLSSSIVDFADSSAKTENDEAVNLSEIKRWLMQFA